MTKERGWFSRRHRTAEAHIAAQQAKECRVADLLATMEENARARAKRSPKEQLRVLDERLGRNEGAVKERRRLKAQIERKRNGKQRKRSRASR